MRHKRNTRDKMDGLGKCGCSWDRARTKILVMLRLLFIISLSFYHSSPSLPLHLLPSTASMIMSRLLINLQFNSLFPSLTQSDTPYLELLSLFLLLPLNISQVQMSVKRELFSRNEESSKKRFSFTIFRLRRCWETRISF